MRRRVIKAFIVGKDSVASINCAQKSADTGILLRILLRVYLLLVLLGGHTNQFVRADRVECRGQPGAWLCFETGVPLLWSTRTSPRSPDSAVSC